MKNENCSARCCPVQDGDRRQRLAIRPDLVCASAGLDRILLVIIARAKLKIGMANIVYNVKRLIWLKNSAMA